MAPATTQASLQNAAIGFWQGRHGLSIGAATAVLDRRALSAELDARYIPQGITAIYRRRIRPRSLRLVWSCRGALERRAKRLADILIASLVLCLSAPLLFATVLPGRLSRRAALSRLALIGLQGRPFLVPYLALTAAPSGKGSVSGGSTFASMCRWSNVALKFWPVLLGDTTLVGPRPLDRTELSFLGPRERRRLEVTPGLIGLSRARQLANLAFENPALIESEYVDTQSLRRDLAVLVMALLGALLGRRGAKGGVAEARTVSVLGVPVSNLRMAEAIELMAEWLDGHRTRFVAFLNAHCANVSVRDRAYRLALGRADLVLADGIGLRIAGAMLGKPIRENVNGTDLLPRLLARLRGRRMYLLGAAQGVAEAVSRRLQASFPSLVVTATRDGYFTSEQEEEVVREIAASRSDILLVAMGVPGQELFIARQLHRLGVKLVIGVGGLFDFVAGRVPRAPLWMREMGLEWIYRLLCEPGRMWRRYLVGNGLFVLRVLRVRLLGANDPKGG